MITHDDEVLAYIDQLERNQRELLAWALMTARPRVGYDGSAARLVGRAEAGEFGPLP